MRYMNTDSQNGFKQGNDNAKEVADFEKKKALLQNLK